jgi:L-ascorbate metabolism protein UlaG (beta-lactamase superfamily)
MKTKIITSLVMLGLFLSLGSCASTPPTPTALPTATPVPVILEYIGHSAFMITAPDGTRVICDPYKDHPQGLTAFPEDLTADVVTLSHLHPDHSNAMAVNGDPKIILKPESFQAGMIQISGYKSDHGMIGTKSTGMNTVFVFEIAGVKIVHLGAAGVVTQGDILAALEDADVVIMDIMGDSAHPLQGELDQLLELHVRTIIPTHYSLDAETRYFNSATIDEFLQVVPPDLFTLRQGSMLLVFPNMPQQLLILEPMAKEE